MVRALGLSAAIAGLLLGGCVQKIAESRVRSALVEAGLSQHNADCMARRMVDRLSIGQLRKLEVLKGQDRAKLSLPQYIALVRKVGDAEVIAVTTSSAALCASGLAG